MTELVYWAYKHDERSLEGWTKSSNKSGENLWAYTLMRKAMFSIGGVSRCRFLWTTDVISLTEMRVPYGALELPRLDSDTRENIRPWIERAGIVVVLREAQPWNGHSRDGGNDRDTDGDDRQRNRPGPYYGNRPWRNDDHRYRAPRPNATWFAAGASAASWGSRGADGADVTLMTEVRRDSLAVIIAFVVLGVLIGFAVNHCLRCLRKNPGATTKPKLPQQEFNPISSSGGTFLRHRVHAGSQQVGSRVSDAKCSIFQDVAKFISTDMEGVNIDRVVIVTRTGRSSTIT